MKMNNEPQLRETEVSMEMEERNAVGSGTIDNKCRRIDSAAMRKVEK